MALSPRELEDDIIIAHNEIRLNPYVMINELERILEKKGAYYTPSTHMATLIGKRDLNDIVKEAQDVVRLQPPVQPLIHSRELELAARDFINSHKPDMDLAERVERYTNWEGEINEIVHYSKTNIRGIEVLMNIIISDFCGDTKDVETIFNPNYRYFGVRVFNHDLYDYCIVLMYADNIFPNIKTSLLTSANIDEELAAEREKLSKSIAERNQSELSEHFPRDHPKVRFSVFLNDAQRSRRKCRLTENDDGITSLTVLRRKSLEKLCIYKNHDDPDYLYVEPENSRMSRAFNIKQRKDFKLDPGELIVNQQITDLDKEVYTKLFKPKIRDYVYDWYSDPHKDRISKIFNENDSKFYYGDINDVSRFEEDVTRCYGYVPKSSAFAKTSQTEDNANNRKLNFTSSSNDEYKARDVASSHYSFRKIVDSARYERKYSPKAEKIFVDVMERRPRATILETPFDYDRFSKISTIPRRQTTGFGDLTSFNDEKNQKVRNYRLIENNVSDSEDNQKENVLDAYEPRRSTINNEESLFKGLNRVSEVPFDFKKGGQDRSIVDRSTRYTLSSSARKTTRVNPDYSSF